MIFGGSAQLRVMLCVAIVHVLKAESWEHASRRWSEFEKSPASCVGCEFPLLPVHLRAVMVSYADFHRLPAPEAELWPKDSMPL